MKDIHLTLRTMFEENNNTKTQTMLQIPIVLWCQRKERMNMTIFLPQVRGLKIFNFFKIQIIGNVLKFISNRLINNNLRLS